MAITARAEFGQLCPLCHGTSHRRVPCDRRDHRTYSRCAHCNLIFVLPSDFLSLTAEKAEYDLHQNQ